MLVDSHCHLDFPDFAEDLDGVVSRAREAGVAEMLSICTHVTKFDQVLAVAERFDGICCTVGIHPHNAGSEPETSAEQLMAWAEHPKVVGFGETGLDYYYDHAPRDAQQRSFREHIRASREMGLPVIVHTRDADEDTVAILREEHEKGAFPGLIHCFSTSSELAQGALDLGMYISLSGIVTFKSARDLQETVKNLPLDRILVETDAPYLAPVPMRGKRNEPAFTAHTAQKVAELQGISFDAVAQASTENYFRLFSKCTPGAFQGRNG